MRYRGMADSAIYPRIIIMIGKNQKYRRNLSGLERFLRPCHRDSVRHLPILSNCSMLLKEVQILELFRGYEVRVFLQNISCIPLNFKLCRVFHNALQRKIK